MKCLSILFLTLVIVELLLGILVATNFLSLFPINFHKFENLPKAVRDDVTKNVVAMIDDYKLRLSRREVEKYSEQVLYLRFHVQSCEPDELLPEPHEPWPAGWIHYMCGSEDTLEWCAEDMILYKTSEKKLTLTGGQELHVGVSCYRTKPMNRLIHDYDNDFIRYAAHIFPFIVLLKIWYLGRQRLRKGEIAEKEEQRKRDEEAMLARMPHRKGSTTDGSKLPPRRNIVNRRENFRNRRS